MFQRTFIPHSTIAIYVSTVFILLFSPLSATQSEISTTTLADRRERQLQSSILPGLSQFASGLNTRIFNGARSTQELLGRINDYEAKNPGGLLSQANEVFGRKAREPLPPPPPESAVNPPKNPSSNLISKQEHGQLNSLLTGLGALLRSIHGHVDQVLVDKGEEIPDGHSAFQKRMDRFGESFVPPAGSSPEPNTPSDSFTLGPVTIPQKHVEAVDGAGSGVRDPLDKEEALLNGMMTETTDSSDHHRQQRNDSIAHSNDTFSFPRRRLQDIQDSGSDSCIVANATIRGHQFYVLEGIIAVTACHKNCQTVPECRFFSYSEASRLCHLYDTALGVDPRVGMIAGPKFCLENTSETSSTSNLRIPKTQSGTPQQFTGPVIRPGQQQETADISYIKGFETSESAKESNPLPIQGFSAPGGTGAGLLGNGFGNLLGRLGLGAVGAGEREAENLAIGGASGLGGLKGLLNTVHAVMGAGETMMQVFPVAEMVKAGYELSNSGLLQRQIRIGNKETSTAPPVGVNAPEVACLSEGMRCCVPRSASPKYQLDPPKLNGVDSPRCVATYVSQWDSLCTTAKYDDDECGTTILETAGVVVYRNLMVMPGKTMNNAICECTVSKEGGETQSSGKWEYSLARKEEALATRERSEEAVARLASAAKLALQWSDALGGRPEGGSSRNGGSNNNNFLHSLLDLAQDLHGQGAGRASESVNERSKRNTRNPDHSAGNNLGNINSATLALLDALKEIKDNAGNNEGRGRRLEAVNEQDEFYSVDEDDAKQQHPGGSSNGIPSPASPLIPVPLNCSVWLQDCEHNFERLLFDEKCKAVKIVENGCHREDVEVELMEDEQSDRTKKPTYRFRLPSVLAQHALGIVCEFVFAPTPLMAPESDSPPQPLLPSLCPSKHPFPLPEHAPHDEWPEIRERGPLLEMLLALAPDDEVVNALVLTRTLVQQQTPPSSASCSTVPPSSLSSSPETLQTVKASDSSSLSASSHLNLRCGGESFELDPMVSNEDTNGEESTASTREGRRKRNLSLVGKIGHHIYLHLNPSVEAREGDSVSVVFGVPKATGKQTPRWGRQTRLHTSRSS